MMYLVSFIIGGCLGFMLCATLTAGKISDLEQQITILKIKLDKKEIRR